MVSIQGLQSLGKELAPLSKAMKNPLANIPALLPEAIEMGKAKVGILPKATLDWAPQELSQAANCIGESAGLFSHGAKQLLMKHGKKVVERQLELERVADCVIDIYSSTACVARATRALEKKSPSAEHEVMLANAYAEDAKRRVRDNVAKFTGAVSKLDGQRKHIADAIFEHGGYVPQHPLGF